MNKLQYLATKRERKRERKTRVHREHSAQGKDQQQTKLRYSPRLKSSPDLWWEMIALCHPLSPTFYCLHVSGSVKHLLHFVPSLTYSVYFYDFSHFLRSHAFICKSIFHSFVFLFVWLFVCFAIVSFFNP